MKFLDDDDYDDDDDEVYEYAICDCPICFCARDVFSVGDVCIFCSSGAHVNDGIR